MKANEQITRLTARLTALERRLRAIESPDSYLGKAEAADFAKIPLRALERAMRDGELAYSKVGNTTVISRADLSEFIDSRRVASSSDIASYAEAYCLTHPINLR